MTRGINPKLGTPAERFWRKVYKTEGCWYWLGSRTGNGYGCVRRVGLGGAMTAHRYAYYLTHGEMPEGDTCHTCDVRLCVRPSHLFAGSRSDNMKDAAQKGRLGVQKDPALMARLHHSLAVSRGRA